MELSELKLSNIKKGDVVTFYTRNTDPKFGSIGSAEQHMKYGGNGRFEVEKSTRSLEPGMILSSSHQAVKVYQQVDFKVVLVPGMKAEQLEGKELIFRMRPIERIELKPVNKN